MIRFTSISFQTERSESVVVVVVLTSNLDEPKTVLAGTNKVLYDDLVIDVDLVAT